MVRFSLSSFGLVSVLAFPAAVVVVVVVVVVVEGHGTMIDPIPRQPESVYWYQVGCMIGCDCSGGGKEDYPSLESVACANPALPTNTDPDGLTYNAHGKSPRGSWNRYMPWRAPGTSKPIDSCGIASGFRPEAAVQFPHQFTGESGIAQGQRGTDLPPGPVTRWEAGSVVDLSFYLVVNHGGGYQYRVCPTTNDGSTVVDEDCFEQHPLVFADDFHTVVHGAKTIKIPATDVSDGVVPEGYAWRRIPLPACNCDSGSYCTPPGSFADRDFDVSYGHNDLANPEAESYGSCSTGLQFVPPHIADGSWPEGYGYYVSTLVANSGKGGGGGNKADGSFSGNAKSPCASHADSTVCTADTDHGCQWYPEKAVCYESRTATDGSSSSSTAGSEPADSKFCADHADEVSCLAGTQSGERCTWYDSPSKTVCYYAGSVDKTAASDSGKETAVGVAAESDDRGKDGEWHITDKVYAPTDPGTFLLQWRWDNEQTPQIWTTCADIEVVPEGQPIQPVQPIQPTRTEQGESQESSSSGAKVSPPQSFIGSSVLFFLASYFHM